MPYWYIVPVDVIKDEMISLRDVWHIGWLAYGRLTERRVPGSVPGHSW